MGFETRIPLFDLGNVVIRLDFEPFLSWLAACSESGCREKAGAVLRSSLFYEYEFGNISREQFSARLAALYGAEFTLAELEERFCAIFPGPVEGVEELLGDLAKDGPVYALSNTNELHLEWLRREHPRLMGKFSKVFASHEMRARKPHEGIYRRVAEALGVRPGRLVFFDDIAANVEGARRAGLESYLFSEAGEVRRILKRS